MDSLYIHVHTLTHDYKLFCAQMVKIFVKYVYNCAQRYKFYVQSTANRNAFLKRETPDSHWEVRLAFPNQKHHLFVHPIRTPRRPCECESVESVVRVLQSKIIPQELAVNFRLWNVQAGFFLKFIKLKFFPLYTFTMYASIYI